MPRLKTTRTEREYLRRLGKAIRSKRLDECHKLLRDVADAAGISTQYLWSIEQGAATNLSLLVLRRIAHALQFDLSDVFNEAAPRQPLRDPLLEALATRLSRLPDSARTPALLAMFALLDDYHRFINAASANPHQLALPFDGQERKASTPNPRWLPSSRGDTSVTPS